MTAALFAKKNDTAAKIAGALLLASGLAERFAIYRAGGISAKDPSYAIDAQRKRLGNRTQPQTQTRVSA